MVGQGKEALVGGCVRAGDEGLVGRRRFCDEGDLSVEASFLKLDEAGSS